MATITENALDRVRVVLHDALETFDKIEKSREFDGYVVKEEDLTDIKENLEKIETLLNHYESTIPNAMKKEDDEDDEDFE